ncbi:SMI1/KNR4 family protein [Streptomyces halstedii]|uniref:SMI1/KNR4 family protein n=1 Tax=Streptomyces halstedii TaxID=1944 RepID=UPI00382FBDEB
MPDMRSHADALSSLLVPYGDDLGDEVDWAEAEAAYGVEFPSDYKEFVRRFGHGTVEGKICVMLPVATAEPATRRVAYLSDLVRAPSAYGREVRFGSYAYGSDHMLVWGETDSADVLAWVVLGPDPATWPVAVWVRGDAAWVVHPCGTAEFLGKLLRGEFPECPISDTSLVGIPSPRFLHDREEERLAEHGVHPWDED